MEELVNLGFDNQKYKIAYKDLKNWNQGLIGTW